MIYMKDDNVKIVVLETANLDELRKGRPIKTPDGSTLIFWTPDPVWLSEQLVKSGGDGETIGRLIEEATKRPEKPGPRTGYVKKEIKRDG